MKPNQCGHKKQDLRNNGKPSHENVSNNGNQHVKNRTVNVSPCFVEEQVL